MVKHKSARTMPATHCGERSLCRQTHDGSVAYDTAGDARLASGLIINDDRDLKAVRSL
jgi:hypothetical protein